MSSKKIDAEIGCGLAVVFLMVAAYVAVGCKLFEFSLWSLIARDIPWYGDLLGAVFSSPILVPLSVILFIIKLCGASFPLIHI